MPIDLTDHVALVTGSAHRVGRAIALELARRGAHIMVHSYESSSETVRDTVQAIKSMGVDAFAVQADLGTAEGVEQIFTAVREHFGRLNLLVNSASLFQKRTLLEVTLDEWQQTLAVNLTGPFLCTQAAATLMQDNVPPGGAIINICDQGVDGPGPAYAHHGVSKAALWSLTQVSAASLGPDIRVNAIIPGPVMKPDGRAMSDERWAEIGSALPLQRTGTAEDVARAVAYLVQEEFITGTAIHVNGGSHLK
jgi:NAD(P)-dependent dehydrogenase (short-subunit alcohol dehydrogenase family)